MKDKGSDFIKAGEVVDLKPGENITTITLPPGSVTRDHITPERKAYFFMIDQAIETAWDEYCGMYDVFDLACEIYGAPYVSHNAYFWAEDIIITVARAYAQKNNIMPDTCLHIGDGYMERAYERYLEGEAVREYNHELIEMTAKQKQGRRDFIEFSEGRKKINSQGG